MDFGGQPVVFRKRGACWDGEEVSWGQARFALNRVFVGMVWFEVSSSTSKYFIGSEVEDDVIVGVGAEQLSGEEGTRL